MAEGRFERNCTFRKTNENLFNHHRKPSPCKDCQDRQVGCHSVCEKYLQIKEENRFDPSQMTPRQKARTEHNNYMRSKTKKENLWRWGSY